MTSPLPTPSHISWVIDLTVMFCVLGVCLSWLPACGPFRYEVAVAAMTVPLERMIILVAANDDQ